VLWRDETDTQVFAQALAGRAMLRNAFIELQGDLGAGKTSLVRHLLRALGVTGRIKSPTYAVVEPYALPASDAWPTLNIWHFDFYRFTSPREWEDAGFRELFAAPGLKLAEWAEHARAALPAADLVVRIEAQGDNSRQVQLTANTPVGQELIA
jgi:tRNA threonylcarbamoyladenosine biosynthesis protein TsaE